ncbi:MAG: anti-sigma factor, partial [Verrucomicrobiales bacterium]
MKSESPIEPGDLRISAYLFDELPAEEALVVEALLARSPEARSELEEMRATSELLRVSLARELADGLSSVAGEGAPSLAVVANAEIHGNAAVEDKVIEFDSASRKGFSGLQVAAIAAMAAALAAVAATLPGLLPKSGPGEGAVVAGETVKNFEAEPSGRPRGGVSPVGGHEGFSPDPGKGIQLVADFTRSPGGGKGGFAPRTLGSDQMRPAARLLSEDPVDLHSAPLPAELLSYFPDLGDFSKSEITTEMDDPNVVNIYLDTEQFPDPDIVHRRV